jgi:hypothetical protein
MRSESFWQWHRNKLREALSIVALPVLLLAGYSPAQDIYIYPAKGQSQEQPGPRPLRMSFMGGQTDRF